MHFPQSRVAGRVRRPGLTRRWQFAVYALFAAAGLFQATWFGRIATFRDVLGIDLQQLSLLVGSFAAGSTVGLFVAPALYARLGPRRVQVASAALMFTGLVCAGGAASWGGSFAGTFALIAIGSFGFGVFDVSMNASAAAVERRSGRSLMPSFHGMYSAGALIGAGASYVAIEADVPLITHVTVAVVVAAAMVAFAHSASPRRAPAAHSAPGVPSRGRARQFLNVSLLLTGLVVLCFTIVEGTAVNWIAVFSESAHGLSTGRATMGLVVFLVATVLARFASGAVVDRAGHAATLRIGAAVAAAGIVVFVLADGQWPIVLLAVALWGAGISVGFPVTISAAAAAGPAAEAPARVSVVSTFGYAASFVGPPFVGVAAGAIGPPMAVLGLLVLLAVAMIAAAATRVGGR